ncbi:MAG: DUF1830 domain-containing protein [Limnoraphis robusta]|jgi:hypothetical protein|uniref:DUF1830 domain-containing protein n=2 Tax=Limnoraphis robusta TaxID=1118279 RepID=A0A0F5YG49_9CYAN|nr:DUF1830 domain-containing protein [Limnoraphis robusta]KKD37190.1 hypothetical protein WN50_15720 [Limnoraphis robusta CS-951]MEA5497683.1 DUF1830 domain-containing protein [Limnoraphis robusta BA-68 BA1]MEA5520510.1 DUF1830 domain-containing protein [Limnoraphis robusta CCNP1315]MEA5537643.1 DUF1830 domain-containing protein [Limnoraphis robusta Tam1]MEA5547023.1 DUF1830 domain-containing protein [Limnoraphis robusta CCNP1324]
MAQILDPLPSNFSKRILCCYVNATSQIQIARITNIANWYFERVVFPGQRLLLEALPEALLEIHTGSMASAILSDRIPCDRLQIDQEAPSSIIEETHPSKVAQAYHQRIMSQTRRQAVPESLTTPALSVVD